MIDLASALRRRQTVLRWTLVVVGAAVGLVMVARAQVGGDQVSLLARGWLLAERGEWVQVRVADLGRGLPPAG